MTDYDPNRVDPNRLDPNRADPARPLRNDVPSSRAGGTSWNWILGGLAAIVLVLVAMSMMSRSDRTAEGVAPSKETTGQSVPPPANDSVAPSGKEIPRPATPSAPATPNNPPGPNNR